MAKLPPLIDHSPKPVTLHIAGSGERVTFMPTNPHRHAAHRYFREDLERCTGWITWADLYSILTGIFQGVGEMGRRDECIALLGREAVQ